MGRRSGEVSQMTGNLFLDILIIAIIVLVIVELLEQLINQQEQE